LEFNRIVKQFPKGLLNGELMLTVPVLIKGRFNQKIYDVMIDISQKFETKHFNSIWSNYKKSRYFEFLVVELEEIYKNEINKLVDLNIRLIEWVSSKLGINTKFVYSSQLDTDGSKTELLVNICKIINADHYISPAGSKEYIDQNNLFIKSGIKLSYQNYKHPTYSQLYGDFIPYMSVIDLLFNEGKKSLELIKSG
jgi:hypothetical protein|tara:strand:- start:167 stop:754 length:588 start_codon:yes stop_codon:yes gene_type:complete